MKSLAVSLLILLQHNSAWHVYNFTQEDPANKEGCPSFESATRPYPDDFVRELSLWPGLTSPFDEAHGESLYGSEEGLRILHSNQNPDDCLNAKYIVSGGWPYGFGSRVHMEGVVMGLALHLGRVYLPHPDGDNIFWETKIPFCKQGEDWDETLTCFYEKFSKCTIKDALANTGGDVNHLRTFYMGDFVSAFESEEGRQRMIKELDKYKSFNVVMTFGGGKYNSKFYIPAPMRRLIDCSPVERGFDFYWWRAVCATYFLRPNLRTLRLLTELSTLPVVDFNKCIAMFVRHGDKGIEMKLLDFDYYKDTAVLMWNKGLVPASPFAEKSYLRRSNSQEYNNDNNTVEGSYHLRRCLHSHNWDRNSPPNGTLFITTEDVAVLKQADKWGSDNQWDIVYTKLFDRSIQTAAKTWQQQHSTAVVHDKLEYISMLLNLQYSLKCETWVCTLASNSCRVIDELRATVGAKANRNYADLSLETCSRPPCIGENIHSLS